MRLPETISVHAGAGRPMGFGELLIADFCDATRAYARLSHMQEPAFVADGAATGGTADAYVTALSLDELMELAQDAADSAPGFTSSSAPDSKNKSTALEGLRAERSGASSDSKSESAPPTKEPGAETKAVAERTIQPSQLNEPTPAYFIIYAPNDELNGDLNEHRARRDSPAHARDFVYAALESICDGSGGKLCGVLFIGHANLLATKFAGPRMGFWRRRTSEGMDRLIAAARTGMSVAAYEQLASIDGPKASNEAELASNPKADNASERTSTGTGVNDKHVERHTNSKDQSASAADAATERSIIDVTDPLPLSATQLLSRLFIR